MRTVSAHDVAAELRRRLPGLGTKKLHKLLYYCQGHHLAAFGSPLFSETISAWDMGPVVGTLWYEEKTSQPATRQPIELDEAQLNTIGYVVSRYGQLNGTDLEHLTHAERPWLEADARRSPGNSAKIPVESILHYFATEAVADEEADQDIPPLDVDTVAEWLQGTTTPTEPGTPDSIDELHRRMSGYLCA